MVFPGDPMVKLGSQGVMGAEGVLVLRCEVGFISKFTSLLFNGIRGPI